MTNKNQRLKWRAEKEKAKAETLKAEAESTANKPADTIVKPASTETTASAKPASSTKSKSNKKKPNKKKKSKAAATDIPSQARALSLEYLRNWKASRETFKFQKVRQTWLTNNAFDRSKIPKADFSTFVEYVADMQGASRQRLLEKAQALVVEYKEQKASKPAESADNETEQADSEDPAAIKAKEFKRSYQRAKTLVEALA